MKYVSRIGLIFYLSWLVAASAFAADVYCFTEIAASGVTDFAINDRGQVAYTANGRVWLFSNGHTRVIADSGALPKIRSPLAMNSLGHVAFLSGEEGRIGIYLWNGSAASKVNDTANAIHESFPLGISDHDDIAFRFLNPPGVPGIYLARKGKEAKGLVFDRPPELSLRNGPSVSMSGNGIIAFVGIRAGGGRYYDGVYIVSAEQSPRFVVGNRYGIVEGPFISNTGEIIFSALMPLPAQRVPGRITPAPGPSNHLAIYLVPRDGRVAEVMVDGTEFSYMRIFALSDRGEVLFTASKKGDPSVIYVAKKDEINRVIGPTDKPFGDRIMLLPSKGAINGKGQVLFWYSIPNSPGLRLALATPARHSCK